MADWTQTTCCLQSKNCDLWDLLPPSLISLSPRILDAILLNFVFSWNGNKMICYRVCAFCCIITCLKFIFVTQRHGWPHLTVHGTRSRWKINLSFPGWSIECEDDSKRGVRSRSSFSSVSLRATSNFQLNSKEASDGIWRLLNAVFRFDPNSAFPPKRRCDRPFEVWIMRLTRLLLLLPDNNMVTGNSLL